MIIILRNFFLFVDDTSSSVQTFKEILAFFGKDSFLWFALVLLESSRGPF